MRAAAFSAVLIGADVSDPRHGVSIANKFVSDGVKLMTGDFNSGVTIPALEVYARERYAPDYAGRNQSESDRPRIVEQVQAKVDLRYWGGL
jgi:hypothetical protein